MDLQTERDAGGKRRGGREIRKEGGREGREEGGWREGMEGGEEGREGRGGGNSFWPTDNFFRLMRIWGSPL